jgi:hypothetical protein
MTNDLAQQVPAGWYADPEGSPSQRWWDGARWTEHLAPTPRPYGEHLPSSRVPDGTPVDTVWIWLVTVLPYLAMLPIFGWDIGGYMVRSATNPLAQISLIFDPWYLASIALGWPAYGLSAWFAYLDYSALGRLGYPRRFHWAWTLLSSLVYVIGRSVVVRQQAGRGAAPMWVSIMLAVASMIGLVVWFTVVIAVSIPAMVDVISTTTYPT